MKHPDPDKNREDAKILNQASQSEQDPLLLSRYTFNLAQSYRDGGEKEKALENYLVRAKLDFCQEEIFVSLLNAARLKEELDHPEQEIIDLYLRASEFVSTRAEALHGASRLCRYKKRFEEGYQLAKRGLAIAKPAEGLFIEPWIYDYGLLDELAVNGYWSGHYRDCLDACQRLLGDGKMPQDMHDRVKRNADFAINEIERQQDSVPTESITPTTTKDGIHGPKFRPLIKQIKSGNATFYVVEQDFVAERVAASSIWEPHLYDFAELILERNSNVVDVGANFGYHTVSLARMIPNGSLIAFEPLSLSFSQLQMNVLANSIRNVSTFKMAVTDVTGKLIEMDPLESTVYAQERVNLGNVAIGSGGDCAFTVRLDDLNLPKIAFLKIDIQGSELAALRGMRDLIARDRPAFFIEIEEHHLQRFGVSSKMVIEHLMALNYSLLRIKTDWPTDHVALPNERSDLLGRCMSQQKYNTDLLCGSRVELTFENAYFYSDFRTS
jgi:FkbM family methyltransferase